MELWAEKMDVTFRPAIKTALSFPPPLPFECRGFRGAVQGPKGWQSLTLKGSWFAEQKTRQLSPAQ